MSSPDIIKDCCSGTNLGDFCGKYEYIDNPSNCKVKMMELCKHNMGDPRCQNVCTNKYLGDYGKELCSNLLTEYCKYYAKDNDNLCGCHLPDSYYKKIKENIIKKYPPAMAEFVKFKIDNKPGQCVADKCLNSAFKKFRVECPNDVYHFVNCVQSINPTILSDKEVNVNAQQMQECGIKLDASGGTSPFKGSSEEESKSYLMYYLGVAGSSLYGCCVSIVIILIFYMYL